MNDIIKLMRSGYSMDDACKKLNINPKVAREWYNKGWFGEGNSKEFRDFYFAVSSIYSNKRNDDSKSKQKILKLQRINEENKIKDHMDGIVLKMKRGLSRSEAAKKLNLKPSTVNSGYNKGKFGNSTYIKFYIDVRNIENKQKNNHLSKSITYYSKSSSNDIRKHSSNEDIIKQMDKIISLMKIGLSRNEAAKKTNLSIVTVNSWYDEGKEGNLKYINFYNDVKKIENNNVYSHNSKSTNSNIIKCTKCGKKIEADDLIYCTNCGTLLKTAKKTKSESNIKTSEENSIDSVIYYIIILIIFILITFFILINGM